MPEEFLTVAEVAELLKLNQQTVRNWIDAGKLPALHIGRRVRIRRADFDVFLGQQPASGEDAERGVKSEPAPTSAVQANKPVGVPAPPGGIDTQQLTRAWVFAQYGGAMLQVQAFEANLASLLLVAERSPTPEPTTSYRPAVKLLKRAKHLLDHGSASEMRNALKGKIAEDLLIEISELVEWRNFLAHRYLRARLFERSATELNTDFGMVVELLELGKAFGACSQRVNAEKTRLMATWNLDAPSGEAMQQAAIVRAALERLVSTFFSKQQPRFVPKPSQAQADAETTN